MELTKDTIQHLIATDKRAVARALVVLYQRQTADEQNQETTKYSNGIGFKSCHARVGTSFATQFLRTGWLSDKQIAYARERMKISQYWRQLLEAAKEKAAGTVQ